MSNFAPRDPQEHERGKRGEDVADYCRNCHQPFLDHQNSVCPVDFTDRGRWQPDQRAKPLAREDGSDSRRPPTSKHKPTAEEGVIRIERSMAELNKARLEMHTAMDNKYGLSRKGRRDADWKQAIKDYAALYGEAETRAELAEKGYIYPTGETLRPIREGQTQPSTRVDSPKHSTKTAQVR